MKDIGNAIKGKKDLEKERTQLEDANDYNKQTVSKYHFKPFLM